jgi:hypothetical protein
MIRRRRSLLRRIAWTALTVLALYLFVAYVALPRIWTHYEHEPGLEGRTMLTVTADGIPGDPINVGLVATKAEAIRALVAAGWYPADAITFRTSMEIAGSVLLDRPYRDAPVSPLFYEGKQQAFAFEKPAGESADRRNHVRFFETLGEWTQARPVWLGSATFDRGVGVSHYTGEITHHIAPDVDAERDLLIGDLIEAHMLTDIYDVTGVGPTLFGHNGGGDPYFTDGELRIGVVSEGAAPVEAPPKVLANPPAVDFKNRIFSAVKPYLPGAAPPEVEKSGTPD